jgi:hypothetical protein
MVDRQGGTLYGIEADPPRFHALLAFWLSLITLWDLIGSASRTVKCTAEAFTLMCRFLQVWHPAPRGGMALT